MYLLKWINKYRNVLIICALILAYLLTWKPNEFIHSFEGIKYRLNKDEILEVTRVDFDGTITKPILGSKTFKGTIAINDENYGNIELKFDKRNSAYIDYTKDSGPSHSLGAIHFDESYKSFTIILFEKTGENTGGWSREDGLTITAPAKNREEAIKLSSQHLSR